MIQHQLRYSIRDSRHNCKRQHEAKEEWASLPASQFAAECSASSKIISPLATSAVALEAITSVVANRGLDLSVVVIELERRRGERGFNFYLNP